MDAVQILTLALVQGLTEFLPISSSAHLILAPLLFGFQDQGLDFDVAVHFGSLLAVLLYFRRDLVPICIDTVGTLGGSAPTVNSRLGWAIVVATVPVMVAGLALKGLVETDLRSASVIAAATIGFGLLLWFADTRPNRRRDEHGLSLKEALLIGLFQALALVPGTSRSGITMTAGLLLGLTRQAAARFSFLLAIPTILMSAGLVTLELLLSAEGVDWSDLLTGVALSFAAAYACIHYFLRFIERVGMLPFVLYRILLGVLIIALTIR